jgi:hypothetical protein
MTSRLVLLLGAALGLAVLPVSAQTKPPPPGATAPTATAPSWNGSWSGAFGARSDIVVTISLDKVARVALLGQPLTITASSITPTVASMSGPDFSLTLTRVSPGSAQGAYENNRKEKASALFSKN